MIITNKKKHLKILIGTKFEDMNFDGNPFFQSVFFKVFETEELISFFKKILLKNDRLFPRCL